MQPGPVVRLPGLSLQPVVGGHGRLLRLVTDPQSGQPGPKQIPLLLGPYRGAHWLTDALAGCALAAVWIAFLTATSLLAMGQGRRRAVLPMTGTFRRSGSSEVPNRDRMAQFG